jgi:hypothetical protein
MKKILIFSSIVMVLLSAACKKSSTTDNTTGSEFKFTSLVAADTLIKVNAITSVTASAAGDGLTYKWSASYGTFVGSGATVQWTVCHQDKFTITCQVSDKYNHSETKSVVVRSHN